MKENEKLTLSGGFEDGGTALQITRCSQANIDALRSEHEEECLPMFHMPWDYIHQEELLYGALIRM